VPEVTAPVALSTWFRATPVDAEPEGWDEGRDDQPITELDMHPAQVDL
jgi:hypothetical protein